MKKFNHEIDASAIRSANSKERKDFKFMLDAVSACNKRNTPHVVYKAGSMYRLITKENWDEICHLDSSKTRYLIHSNDL